MTGTDTTERTTWDRVFSVVLFLTIAPILITAVRLGLDGWIPTNDAAPTVVRAKHALGAHPTMVGMFAWPTSAALQTDVFLPGPWQLWWLWAPIRLLGMTWGPLLSMAALNSAWLGLTGWLIRRDMGPRHATLAMIFSAMLVWSFGAGVFSSPVPLIATIPPLIAFFFTSWLTALGHRRALPWLAASASFTVLTNPQSTMIMAVLFLGTLACVIAHLWQVHRAQPESWSVERRGWIRSASIAVAVTIVGWLPPLIQELTTSPGNLTNTWRGLAAMEPVTMPLSDSIAAVMSLFLPSRFWLAGSMGHSYNTGTADLPSAPVAWTAFVLLLVVITAAGMAALRRRDRSTLVGLTLGVGALIGGIVHRRHGPQGAYYFPLWVVAMFITFTIVGAVVRAIPRRVREGTPATAIGIAGVLFALNIPMSDPPHSTAGSTAQIRTSHELNNLLIPQLRNRGTIRLAAPTLEMFPYSAALAAALEDAGIPFCANHIASFVGYRNPACDDTGAGLTVVYRSTDYFIGPLEHERVFARLDSLNPDELTIWGLRSSQLDDGVRQAAASGRGLPVSPDLVTFAQEPSNTRLAQFLTEQRDLFDDPVSIVTDFEARDRFGELVRTVDDLSAGSVSVTTIPGMSEDELVEWAGLLVKLRGGIVVTAAESQGDSRSIYGRYEFDDD